MGRVVLPGRGRVKDVRTCSEKGGEKGKSPLERAQASHASTTGEKGGTRILPVKKREKEKWVLSDGEKEKPHFFTFRTGREEGK